MAGTWGALITADAGLADAATYKEKQDAHNAIMAAADGLVTALKAHGGSDADIATATGRSAAAKEMAGTWGALITADAAFTAAQGAVDMDGTNEEMKEDYQALQTAADALVTALKAAGEDTTAAAKVSGEAKAMVANLNQKIADAAKKAADDAKKAADDASAAMMALTAKLWTAIGETPLANNGSGTDFANDTGVFSVERVVTGGNNGSAALKKDKDVMAMHGWEGSEHTGTATTANGGGSYTARIYTNMEAPTEGDKFSTLSGYNSTDDNLPSGSFDAGKVASPSITVTAGTQEFDLPDNTLQVRFSGTYHGVAGTYNCTPSDTNTKCSATVADPGFTFAGGTWTFSPNDPDDKVSSGADDTVYLAYGWWLHEADDGTATVSAFIAERGEVTDASGIDTLKGTATYKGGAAGKYAISAGTHNDAGHFTADAMLEADFNADKITGTINNFMGSDGMARDWSVSLEEGSIADNGTIATVSDGTVWTMGGMDGSASGQWSGTLQGNDGGVPTMGTGVFHSEFGNTGRMVGAFGVDKQ